MSQRVNFLEKGAFVLTYKKILIIAILWTTCCFSLFMLESGYSWWLGKRIVMYKSALTKLNAQKERTLALVEASKVERVEPDVKQLSEVFENFPAWSNVLASLGKSMPPQVQITSVSSQYLAENSMVRKIEIGGASKNTSSVAGFVKQLNDKPIFHNMVLSKSDRIEEENRKTGYSFVVIGEVVFGEKKWD